MAPFTGLISILVAMGLPAVTTCFSVGRSEFRSTSSAVKKTFSSFVLYQSSFVADGSEYSSRDSSDMDDDMDDDRNSYDRNYRDNQDETPTIELSPVPMSKNAGSRFVAFFWDAQLNEDPKKDGLDLHYDRIALTEEHVMFCRKTNLYNETFNHDSMVDVLWSLPILSSDLRRLIGHAVCLESTDLKYVQDFMAAEPLSRMLTGGDASKVPLYRWRHIRDYTLRIDDGRNGFPCMCLGMDAPPEEIGSDLRESVWEDMLEYFIRSERIIAAGPLHLPTEFKDDPSSLPVGDLILFNAADRDSAIKFVEDLPAAQAGLYETLRVNFYNKLDITGKFVSEDPLRDAPGSDLKEAMHVWGYPVQDEQTPWLNF
mmetsp:Transcript_96/g.144  ORF Transcript_96/g.144 Transcript_96/m.144 type:complete len:370 (-) Transcript_96:122-1231(-)